MIKPYNSDFSKKSEVKIMFDRIASNYDFLNHFLSGGIDILWRKRLINELVKNSPTNVLDIATGTGDLAIMAAKAGVKSVTGIDLSPEMVAVGNKKVEKRLFSEQIKLEVGDAENLPYSDNCFSSAMVAFGVRNFENLSEGLKEIHRVIKKDGGLYVLEFSKPRNRFVSTFYNFYSFRILPIIGRAVSKESNAYTYLPESIKSFQSGNAFIESMESVGFSNCKSIELLNGIATIYIGYKI